MIRLTRTVLGRTLEAEARMLDDGLAVLMTGGDRSHIGAISWCQPGGEPETKVFPGHKDQFISGPWSKALSEQTGRRTAVICGVHYDGASPDHIQAILRAAEEMLSELLAQLHAR